ncbi:MAG: MoxR family ATPase [Bacteroidetes bacterium]|nr:MAG: MoxR family ATPase [Bacteroidota bacterium]
MEQENFQIAFGNYDKSPESYYLSETNPLRATILLALKLGKPLLITGEPGTGKTQLAYWAAWYLHSKRDNNLTPFLVHPFVFNTKTGSAGKDLFYQYDAISHFQDKEGKKNVAEFISLSAMGQAICQTHGRDTILSKYGLGGIRNIDSLRNEPHSSVLLIDEIDKASRDFTNDLLNEIENNKFTISELEKEIVRSEDRRTRSLVIMTSNSEKTLPDAFLRRCLFYNVPFPTDDELLSIILGRLGPFIQELGRDNHIDFTEHYKYAIHLFHVIRSKSNVKPPSISELLDWVKVLHIEEIIKDKIDEKNVEYLPAYRKKALQLSLYTLIKTREDMNEIEQLLKLR